MEQAQYAALGKVNAPIGDRYYVAASSTPARVFATLVRGLRGLRGLRMHVSDARKRGRGGWIEPRVGDIVDKPPSDLPKTLRLEDPGPLRPRLLPREGVRPAEIDPAQWAFLKARLEAIIHASRDSLRFYCYLSSDWTRRIEHGAKPATDLGVPLI